VEFPVEFTSKMLRVNFASEKKSKLNSQYLLEFLAHVLITYD